MTREEYQKECLDSFIREEYDSMVWGDNLFTDHVRKMFNAGIQCADTMPKSGLVDLSKVWHDTKEEPKDKAYIIAERRNLEFGSFLWANQIKWEKFTEIFLIKRWAYVDELLPKGGEP